MYCLVVAIRLDTLPTDPAVLTEMVLALDAENDQLRAVVQTLKDMIFGAQSERLTGVAAEQLALELNDLETGVTPPLAGNNDKPADKLSGMSTKTRKKAIRNIGALPKHLPRCEQVSEPETVPAARASSIRSAKMSTKCST
jgi:transposase